MMMSAPKFAAYPSSEPLVLGRGEVHIWRAWLDQPDSQHLKRTLAPEERIRASRFRFAADRHHFVAARGILRAILGRYLNLDPRTLRFAYNGYGKPTLTEENEDGPIQFNLSHSQNLALYAVTRQESVGIDVEYISPEQKEYASLAQRYFSSAEVAELRAVPPEQQQAAFLNGWTRKEAYIKARGMGLSLDLRQFDVSLSPGAPAAFLANREAGQEHVSWSLYELAPAPGFVAALAVEGAIEALRCWQWSAKGT